MTFHGSQVFTAGPGCSVRTWACTEDLVFVEEEKERALDAQMDNSLNWTRKSKTHTREK